MPKVQKLSNLATLVVGRQYNFKFEVFVQKVLLKLRYNISNLCVANFYTRCFISTLVNQASSNSKDLILSTLESVKGWYGINNIYLVIALGLNIAIENVPAILVKAQANPTAIWSVLM